MLTASPGKVAKMENNEKLESQKPEDHDEYEYLNLIRKVMKNGKQKQDRTGIM